MGQVTQLSRSVLCVLAFWRDLRLVGFGAAGLLFRFGGFAAGLENSASWKRVVVPYSREIIDHG